MPILHLYTREGCLHSWWIYQATLTILLLTILEQQERFTRTCYLLISNTREILGGSEFRSHDHEIHSPCSVGRPLNLGPVIDLVWMSSTSYSCHTVKQSRSLEPYCHSYHSKTIFPTRKTNNHGERDRKEPIIQRTGRYDDRIRSTSGSIYDEWMKVSFDPPIFAVRARLQLTRPLEFKTTLVAHIPRPWGRISDRSWWFDEQSGVRRRLQERNRSQLLICWWRSRSCVRYLPWWFYYWGSEKWSNVTLLM